MHTKDMVLKKRLDYGVNGCGFPFIPRGLRSRRVSHKKNIEDSQICAFELLADVAGKLLQESESSASSNAAEENDPFGIQCVGFKKEKKEEGKALTTECLDGGSCVGSSFLSELAAKRSYARSTLSELIQKDCRTVLERASIISSSDNSKKAGDNVKLEIPDGQAAVKICCIKPEGSFPHCGELSSGYVDNGIERQLEAKEKFNHNSYFTATNISTSKDKLDIRVNSCPLINSDSSVQLTSFRGSIRNASFLRHGNSTTVSNRDDDDNFTVCKRRKCNIRAFRPQSCGGYRRLRKSSASKYLKVIPKLKDCEFSNADGGMRHIFRNKRSLYTSDRIRRKGPFKKRKLFDGSSKHVYDREESSESISNTPEKGMKGDKSGSAMTSHKACGISSPFVGHATSFRSRDSRVKFSIKSFKVPELYIEVPETATVGSLKRTVMEAVAAILQEGLHVGVLLQGEKVQDDERTLLQTGISHNGNLDNLGFTLEPSSVIASPPMSLENPSPLLPYGTPQQLTRFVTSPTLESGLINASSDPLHVANVDNHVTSNHELVPLATDLVADAEAPDSRALVPLPAARLEALAVVSMTQKAKKTEIVQRRTRRPFSVAEVEALVEAVETLGTGRWRDVKLHAFENADHRTYVDLKDKWKTLVHTASISPQQRRGEPVPQVLLDRVLCAHSCWSQNQSKQLNKNQAEPLQLSTVLAGTV